jgi:23S rRNA pseudouridine1911/1915/1917 synthase
MIFSSAVPTGTRKGTMLPDYLAGRFTYHGRDEWEALAAQGKITVNGCAARAGDTVVTGDMVAYDPGEFEEPAADLSYRIIFEDAWLLGIDKPGNLLVHRAGRSFRNNLMYQLRYVHEPTYPAVHAAHRLDRGTSGVLCVAKNAEVLSALARQFADGKVDKTYLAVVRGAPKARELDFPIGKISEPVPSCRHGVVQGGKAARTLIAAVQPLGLQHSLVTVRPLTGRTHQIRVHLAAVGAPVVGDRLYGVEDGLFSRHALHCALLSFVHPVTGRECRMEAVLPADMKELIKRLADQTKPDGYEAQAYTL